MKRLILDHLRRWGWLWAIIGIANGFMAGAAVGDKHQVFNVISFPMLLWLGAMQLQQDLIRGICRVQNTLPVTAQKIGRAWWIVSVGLPSLLLFMTSGLALLIHSLHMGNPFPTQYFVTYATTNSLFLGVMFSLFVDEFPGLSQPSFEWLRRILSVSLMFGMLFSLIKSNSPFTLPMLVLAAFVTVIGWFRAEQMVVRRATFKPGIQTGKNPPGQHRAPSGGGGLGYLIWRTFARSTFAGLAIMIFMVLFTQFISHKQTRPPLENVQFMIQTLSSGTAPYVFFILLFSLVPMAFQLRQLRTMPIASTTLATVMILVPVLSVLTVGFGIAGIGKFITGGTVLIPVMNSFLMLGAKTAIISAIIIWRGLKTLTGLLVFILIIADSFTQLGATLTYHSGTITENISCGISSVICLVFTLIGIALTQGIIKTSSHSYRPPATNMVGWGNWGGGR